MLSLYCHIPFCIHKCGYCDFYSIGMGDREVPAKAYMSRLCEELCVMVETLDLRGQPLTSIFFGGGTPSMIPAKAFEPFFKIVSEVFSLDDNLEVTCEANPETVDVAKLKSLRDVGINRLSVGVQSFQPHHLKFMERVHSPERAVQAIGAAQTAGFTNINLDLIFGLPNQTLDELNADVDQALQLGTQHISAYQLTVEARTPLAMQVAKGDVTPINDERSLLFWQHVRARMTDAGYAPYEVSNYAQPGFECHHNQHYWRCGPYLGLGTGAVSRVGDRRWRRARNLKTYLAGTLLTDDEETLEPGTHQFEAAMLGLRTCEGVDANNFDHNYQGLRKQWIADGYAKPGPRLSMTTEGLALLDSLLETLDNA